MLEMLEKQIFKKIASLTDSQTTLKAFAGVKVTSKLIWEFKVLLNHLAKNNEVQLISESLDTVDEMKMRKQTI